MRDVGPTSDPSVEAFGRPAVTLSIESRQVNATPTASELVPVLCLNESELLDAFRLRYRNYSERGHIPQNAEHLFYDRYDALPNCITFAILSGNRMVGSIRACAYAPTLGWVALPARDAYESAFRELVGQRPIAIEWNRLVVDDTFGRAQDVQVSLWACAAWFANRCTPPIFLAGVRAPHVPYYRRMGFSVASEPRLYPGTTFYATLMGMDWAAHGARLCRDRRFARLFAGAETVRAAPERSMELFRARFEPLVDVV